MYRIIYIRIEILKGFVMDKLQLGTNGVTAVGSAFLIKLMAPYAGFIINPLVFFGFVSAGLIAITAALWPSHKGYCESEEVYYAMEWNNFFKSMKFYNADSLTPKYIRKVKTEYGTDYHFKLPQGMNSTHFEKIALSTEQFLNKKMQYEYKDGDMILHTYDTKLKDSYLYKEVKHELKVGSMEFILGYTVKGLRKAKLKSHWLICGTSGFGKSSLERLIIVMLMLFNKPSNLVMTMTDFKRNEMGIFKNSEFVKRFCTEMAEFKKLLEDLEQRAKERYALFEKENILDIDDYNKKHSKKLPYMVNVIDEIAQLEGNKKMMSLLQKRVSYDRAAGIYYIICTQRPSVDLIPGSLKANIDNRVCFKTVDSTNSWIVLDDKEAAQYLTTPGRGLLRTAGEDLIEFQAPYLTSDEATELIKHTFKKKKGDIQC
jgi:S-DNA-T family DNA segregation ATPase FtsK/SpoIIIE